MEDFLAGLNSVQHKAVVNIDGPNLIIAGAGSGKTRVLTIKIAYLLTKGIRPSQILALTFTNKAAKEMKERIAKIVDPKLANRLWMGTFHSIFARILRTEAERIGFTSNFTIYDTTDSLSMIRGIVKDLHLDEKVYKDRDIMSRISSGKNGLMTPNAYASNVQLTSEDSETKKPRIAEIYKRYAAKCKQANAMDFDDLLLYTNILFRDHPDVLLKYQSIYQYILVDEYQDTNVAQYLIVKKLAQTHQNLTVVGDDAQSIYSFRGAKIENILNFRKDYPTFNEFKLEQNYRSTQTIVNAANSLIAKNSKQLKKNCFSKGATGDRINLIKAFTDQEEGYLVATAIVDTKYSQQANYGEFAILYRTNAQSRIFEDALRKKNVPYRIYGGISFYQRAEIKDALAYMRLAANPSDDEALKRVINYPARKIGETSMERIQTEANLQQTSLWNIITKTPLAEIGIKEGTIRKIGEFIEIIKYFIPLVNTQEAYEFASEVIQKSGMLADLKANNKPDDIARLENVEELLNGIKDYTNSLQIDDSSINNFPITEYLQNVALITDADQSNDVDQQKVSLMTIHSAKGLEYNYVYVVGIEEGLFPGINTATSLQGLEEERRLFYVAITRAAIQANLSFAHSRYKWGNITNTTPSRFLRDIDPQFLNVPDEIEGISKSNPIRFNPISNNAPRLQALNKLPSSPTNSPEPQDFSDLKVGSLIEHDRFGLGRVSIIEGTGANAKATIAFQNAGNKVLVLRFAKLTILK